MGTYNVGEGEGGMYGLVFDNTFSRQVSKTATFVLMTHPTNAPPKSQAHLHYSQAMAAGSTTSVAKSSPSLRPVADSTDSLPQDSGLATTVRGGPATRKRGSTVKASDGGNFHTGTLWKKRRKRNQGHAKRFFSLDFTSATLSYYRNGHSSALRGAIPLSLAAVGVNEKRREFSVDSGAEVWHLKAGNKKDFEEWKAALERASNTAPGTPGPGTPLHTSSDFPTAALQSPADERDWERVEELVARVSGSRDAARRLAQDTDPKYHGPSPSNGLGISNGGSPSASSIESSSNPFFLDTEDKTSEKVPFWKRKPSSSGGTSPGAIFRRSVSAQVAVSAPSAVPAMSLNAGGGLSLQKKRSQALPQSSGEDVHERCLALLKDLDAVVSDFSALLAESKARRMPPLATSTSRMSLETTSSDEFFDAEDGGVRSSQLLTMSDDVDGGRDQEPSDDASETDDSESSSDAGDAMTVPGSPVKASDAFSSLFPSRPRSLSPLPLPSVQRRTTIPPPVQPPPSIIGFLRRNAGKDLSTVSMPVSANEPTSLLQKLAEPLEASALLDAAASLSAAAQATERLLHVAVFAIAGFAANRVKERAIRKPFNPMLGETYELVREDLGFRFVAEKVEHHPLRMAFQADGAGWSLGQTASPVQKFWGKSVELNTLGKTRLVLHDVQASESITTRGGGGGGGGECYSWQQATCFLRNVIAGEKYVEPVASMTIICESSGAKAIATFKAGGMFAGRSEDVSIALYTPTSPAPLPLGLAGKWTSGLARTDTGASVWTPGPLVPDAAKCYGFTAFAAALNQVTGVEEGRLPPTDSRLRPDQRALEEGLLDKAEGLKARLEERQRARKKVLEGHGAKWSPTFFEKVEGAGAVDKDEEGGVFRLRVGKEGYWERREGGHWEGVGEVFQV